MDSLAADGESDVFVVETDLDVTYRYARAAGDFNPIHLDDEFARSVGLPGRILHGLWTMAQLARVHTQNGGPASLRSLSVEFRGYGQPGKPLEIRCDVKEQNGREIVVEGVVEQMGTPIVLNARARVAQTRSSGLGCRDD
jgi:acyl dehydratase